MATAKKAAPAKTAAKKTASKTPAKKTAVKSSESKNHAPTHAEIAALAHKYSQERGPHHGNHVDDWLRAERELLGR
jgi:hypothetical protein